MSIDVDLSIQIPQKMNKYDRNSHKKDFLDCISNFFGVLYQALHIGLFSGLHGYGKY